MSNEATPPRRLWEESAEWLLDNLKENKDMYEFPEIAKKLLKEYKSLIKRHLSAEEGVQKLSELGLDRKLPARENALYHLLLEVINKTSAEVGILQSRLRYSGAYQFLQHMKDVVSAYRLEQGRVIHVPKTVSKAMIQGIQLMSLPEQKLSTSIAKQLEEYALYVAKYGLDEQKSVFLNSLKSHLPRHRDFFQPLLNCYQHYLSASLAYPESEPC